MGNSTVPIPVLPTLPERNPRVPKVFRAHRDILIVLGVALALRLGFSLLVSNTYDYDEFVILLLGRDFAHGSVPYRDFMFFHPPGALVIFRALESLTVVWWPAARVFSSLVDTVTAGLVWLIAARLYSPRTALGAGLLYAVSPLALISAARVGQDPLITAVGFAGLAILLIRPSNRAGIIAGLLLGLAIWIKYPALYFLPIYILASPRRAAVVVTGLVVGFVALMLPFHAEWRQLYFQTVTFQRARWLMAPDVRIETGALYWLGVNAIAVIGLFRSPPRPWLIAAFVLGGVFILSSQVYYHYFVPIVPFAALLAAPVVTRWLRTALAVGGIVALVWGAMINLGGPSPLYVTAAHLTQIQPAVALLDRTTRPDQAVLADRYEYAYLSRRPASEHYFWNIGVLVGANQLERGLDSTRVVVLSHGASSGYPAGFLDYLNSRYPRVSVTGTTIWLLPGTHK